MKTVQLALYEKGDHIMVTSGYNRGKVGTVLSHPKADGVVIYELAGVTYRNADEDDYDSDDDDYYGDYESSSTRFVKYITKQEYEKIVKKLKVLEVPGLPVGVRFQGANLIIGDNVITPAHAKQLAEFITQNTKTKGKKK